MLPLIRLFRFYRRSGHTLGTALRRAWRARKWTA